MQIVIYIYRYKFVLISLMLIFVLRGFGLPIDFVQTLVFPIFLLSLWFAFGRSNYSVYLLIAVMLLWGFSALHIRGYIVSPLTFPGAYIAHLDSAHLDSANSDSDEDNQKAIALHQRFNEIARTYELNELRFVHRKFATSESSRNWLDRTNNTSFLISGNPMWLDVVFTSRQSNYFNFDLAEHSIFSYAIPDKFSIASEHQELTLHFLAWFSQGLMKDENSEQSRAGRDEALLIAATSLGQWKSALPLAVAQLFLGTRYSIENQDEIALANCAQRAFEGAASYVSRESDPEAFAAIFNNAAVNKLRYAESDEDMRLAEHLLWRAVGARGGNGSFLPSVRLAYRNLELMYQNGLL